MNPQDVPVTLATLLDSGIRPYPHQAVALIQAMIARVIANLRAGHSSAIPSPGGIAIDSAGEVHLDVGAIDTPGEPVVVLGRLLHALLPEPGASAEFRVTGPLRYAVARAMGELELPPFPSVEQFSEQLGRFERGERHDALRAWVTRWREAAKPFWTPEARSQAAAESTPSAPLIDADAARRRAEAQEPSSSEVRPPDEPPFEALPIVPASLTIDEIRRWRRSTGVPLKNIARRTGIPVERLRELEWGYFEQWPTERVARFWLRSYAIEAGIDPELLIASVQQCLPDHVRASVQSEPGAAPEPPSAVVTPIAPRSRRSKLSNDILALAAAAAAVVGLALIPATLTRHLDSSGNQSEQAAETRGSSREPIADRGSATAGQSSPTSPRPTDAPPLLTAPAARPTVASDEARDETPSSVLATRQRSVEQPLSSPPLDLDKSRPDRPVQDAIARAADDLDDGRLVQALDVQQRPVFSPSFASNGSAVFFHTGRSGQSSSAVMEADLDKQGEFLQITTVVNDGARNYHAQLSPDGKTVAFDSDRDGERGVYLADRSGHNVRRVSGPGYAAVPSWSPDGTRLAFVKAEPDSPKVWNLWLLDLRTNEQRRLTSYRYGQPWSGSWFPDGRRICYSHETTLVVLDTVTGDRRVFKSPLPGHLARTPAVSPDGERVMFQVYRDGAWILDVKDGSMMRALADPSAEEFAWAPDGRRVAFHSRRNGEWGLWWMAPQ